MKRRVHVRSCLSSRLKPARWVAALTGLLLVAVPVGAAATDEAPLEPGLSLRIYQVEGPLDHLVEPAEGQTPNLDKRIERLRFAGPQDFGGHADRFIAIVEGYLLVEQEGPHEFRLSSDDGSLLTIDGRRIALLEGVAPRRTAGGRAHLSPGLHRLRVVMFENEGDEHLSVSWRPPGAAAFADLSAAHTRTEAGVTRVVSPGPKKTTDDVAGLRAGDGVPLRDVHPGWRVERARPAGFDPMVGAMTFLPDGRLLVACFEPMNNGVWVTAPNGTIYALSNLDAENPDDIRVETFAEGLYHPLGMCVVDGDLYVAERDCISRFRSIDGGYAPREVFASGWTSDNYHHFTFGLVEHEGFLYATLSTSIGHGEDEVFSGEEIGLNSANPPNRGAAMRISLEDGAIEYIAGGLRTPNGVLVTRGGELLVGENQGAWMPASKINHIRPGRFYGHYNETRVKTTRYPDGGVPALFSDQPPEPPAVWLPQNEISNSPTSLLEIPDGPFAGQLYVGELKLGGIRRVFLEEVEGQLQGAVFRFTQGLEGGVNRLEWGPDGTIYAGMIGERDTWSWQRTRFGLQRLVPTGETTFEMQGVSATPKGFEIRFTRPVPREQLEDPSAYLVQQWRYMPGPEYGGEKHDVETLQVTSAEAGPDRRSVRIVVEGLEEGRCVYLRTDPTSDAGERLWATEVWYTLNRVPERSTAVAIPSGSRGRILVFTKTAGFRHESIPSGVEAFRQIADGLGLGVEHTEDARVFRDEALAEFGAVVFLNTSGDILNLAQEAAFERFVRAGGGFVGVHSASSTERDWAWFGRLVGAYFDRHPHVQPAEIEVLDREHAATRHLPERWARTDEWYDFEALPRPGVRRLLNLDERTYTGGGMGPDHPIAWCHEEFGGRAFYTGGGHADESYADPDFRAHLRGGLLWVLGRGETPGDDAAASAAGTGGAE